MKFRGVYFHEKSFFLPSLETTITKYIPYYFYFIEISNHINNTY